ncbi:unnamed protein product [Arctia plantaginis]|uniref:RNA helicase n=1 Tax=Arctia plantaginis TaxID=874455 RepID=A0A8S1BC34_ARCPL|nr:unnamed protein product [Arctia plantaginis]
MVSYIKSFYHHWFPNTSEEETDLDQFLAEQLVELEIDEQETNEDVISSTPKIPRSAACYQRTGVITYMGENYILIDGMISFDTSACGLNLQVMDKVLYLCYKDANDTIIIVRILESLGTFWGDEEEAVDESSYNVIEHVFVGEVDNREDRAVFIKNTNLKFDLDHVTGTFIPIPGDWLELLCKVKFDDDKPMDITFDLVVEVLSFKPVRSKVKSALITGWTGDIGVCDKQIFFEKCCIVNSVQPTVGSKVLIEAIESNQGSCSWRVIKMHITETMMISESVSENSKPILAVDDIEEKSFEVERKKNIEVTFPLKFDNVTFQQNPSITLNITNNSDEQIVVNKWIMLCKKRDSQINISPFLTRPKKIGPGQSCSFTIICQPKFYGQCKEHLIILFRGFQVERIIEINVLSNNNLGVTTSADGVRKTESEKINMLKRIKKEDNRSFVPGVKKTRAPNFVAVRLGMFPVPDKVWNAVLGDSNETIHHVDYSKIISRIESYLPCLIQTLNINNYMDRWHTLIYMEEIQVTVDMRSYDISKAFLIRCQEYLGIEINGLAEKRPSLIAGDKVMVKDIWDSNKPLYEGFVHLIKGDLVLMKFHPRFHESYSGSDVSIQFHFNRSVFRRAHQAVNLAISNLGVDILFPNRIKLRNPQLPSDKVESIEWYNKDLNSGQKAAIKNILLGECRPMPYCIYGPPGTGKTMTVIETILQILTLMPDSRILVATPSNSAANLLTERLLKYKKLFSNSVVRLIANYLVDNENIPDIIKPYCATINISKEDTIKSNHTVKDSINLDVSASYVARYRVSIGTCYCLGSLAQLGLPKGHFTHVIVDEAGQALEPEIMIPLTFADKENGQIVLAGDPMQLGPVVSSKYCAEFGYDESYMSRILETFPYQRDYNAFVNGFNEKLVTRLSENYRSLEEVITLPSKMFYDGSLVPRLPRNMPWIEHMLNVVSEVFESTNEPKTGGIFVHGVKGCNTRAEDSPSWFNPQEASMVALTACKLFKKNISPDEIGIITPYIAQIKYIRLLFDAMGLPRPKIGTVEEFQGQEKPLIIISTVRTTEAYVIIDQKHALGFVKNPKRLNVALTRAQVATLLFCDPHLLLSDPLWQQVINHAIKSDKYMGCDLLFTHNSQYNDIIKE